MRKTPEVERTDEDWKLYSRRPTNALFTDGPARTDQTIDPTEDEGDDTE